MGERTDETRGFYDENKMASIAFKIKSGAPVDPGTRTRYEAQIASLGSQPVVETTQGEVAVTETPISAEDAAVAAAELDEAQMPDVIDEPMVPENNARAQEEGLTPDQILDSAWKVAVDSKTHLPYPDDFVKNMIARGITPDEWKREGTSAAPEEDFQVVDAIPVEEEETGGSNGGGSDGKAERPEEEPKGTVWYPELEKDILEATKVPRVENPAQKREDLDRNRQAALRLIDHDIKVQPLIEGDDDEKERQRVILNMTRRLVFEEVPEAVGGIKTEQAEKFLNHININVDRVKEEREKKKHAPGPEPVTDHGPEAGRTGTPPRPAETDTSREAPTMDPYLEQLIKMEPGFTRTELLKSWLQEKKPTGELFIRVMSALGEKELKKVEIPTEPNEFRKFMRQRVREVIRLANNPNQLTLDAIEKSLIADLSRSVGLDPSKGFTIELFPIALGENLEDIKQDIETEIEARSNLRILQIQEESYKINSDKAAALSKYINDTKGTESSAANPSIVARETYTWLKELKDFGDPKGATTEKVDRAFAILLRLGEDNPDFSEVWAHGFEIFRPEDLKNVYDPSYNVNRRAKAMNMISERFGEDAKTLALQLFQAYKEEGNFNWQHYMSGLFKFADARHNLATLIDPPVFGGSRRVYLKGQEDPGHTSYKDELQFLAVSPLNVPAKVGERDVLDEKGKKVLDEKGKVKKEDVKVNGTFALRAKAGRYLQDTDFVDTKLMKYLPEVDAFSIIKSAEKIKKAIADIGALGVESDKNLAVAKAKDFLSEIRISGESIVKGYNETIKQKDLDAQIYWEVRNVIFELSIVNPINIRDLSTQSREKPKFLLPSGLAELMVRLGDWAGTSDYFILAEYDVNDKEKRHPNFRFFGDIKTRVQKLRTDTLEILERRPEDGGMRFGENDQKIIDRQVENMERVGLPDKPGEGLKAIDSVGRNIVNKTINQPLGKIQGRTGIPGIDKYFPKGKIF